MNCYFILLFFVIDCYAYSKRKKEICAAKNIDASIIKQQTYYNSEPISFKSNEVTAFKIVRVKNQNECIRKCCHYKKCNSLLLNKYKCTLLHCKSTGACKPVNFNKKDDGIVFIVLLKLSTSKASQIQNENSSTLSVNLKHIVKDLPVKESNKKNFYANAGPDLNITVNKHRMCSTKQIVLIQGSATNKKGVVLSEGIIYKWKRDPSSLAIGSILNNSDDKSSLMLTCLISGNYTFVLTVFNKDGLSSSDSVNLFVKEKEDYHFKNLVDISMDTDAYNFTEEKLINFTKEMRRVIENNLPFKNCQIHVKHVSVDNKNRTLITLYVEYIDSKTKKVEIIPAKILEYKLKHILPKDVTKFQSRVCYNNCSGHGKCRHHNHRCECNFPWFNDLLHEHRTGNSNCDMHVIVIIIISVVSFLTFIILFLLSKKLAMKCRKKNSIFKEALRYKLLDDNNELE